MKLKIRTFVVALFSLSALLYLSRPAVGCGPFFPTAIFTYAHHPNPPLDRFTRGELGILQPTYERSYLYVAYRHLAGTGFDPKEQRVLLAFWNERLGLGSNGGAGGEKAGWVLKWLEARRKVPGVAAGPDLESFGGPGIHRWARRDDLSYFGYYNCLQDAFRNALITLGERSKQFGSSSPEVRAWVQGQDKVFANCRGPDPVIGKPYLPDNVSPGMHTLLYADRAYQLAAAHFYAGDFDTAKNLFSAIAQDSFSPWRPIASYLVARALVRKATLGAGYGKSDAPTLAQAEAQLQRILRDASLRELHPAARGLLRYVRLRLYPEETLHELARALLQNNREKDLRQDLWDYTVLLDRYLDLGNGYEPKKIFAKQVQNFAATADIRERDDLTDWIITLETPGLEAMNHAVRKWEQNPSLPWLVAALTKVSATHQQVPSLLAAAKKEDFRSSAFATVAFHRLRLLSESGEKEEARAELDALLAEGHARFSLSSLNLLLALRMKIARNLDEFLRHASRVPVGIEYDDDPIYSLKDVTQDKGQKAAGREKALFDVDSARILTEKMPLSVLREVVKSKILPAEQQREVVVAVWVRSVMLDKEESAKELLPLLEAMAPDLRPHLQTYGEGQTREARKFAGVFAILQFPGLRPYVRGGVPRETPLHRLNNYRDNWWCSLDPKAEENYQSHDWHEAETIMNEPLQVLYPGSKVDFPDFLSEVQRATAQEEWEKLAAMPTAPNYLAQQVVEWAKTHPQDPRVPEALHLVVRSTRYGCVDKTTTMFSKAAFQLLYRRYPRSIWAKKTPHWF